RRFLNVEPILARPASTWVRGWKWARRHPARATILAVSILSALTLLTTGLWYHATIQAEQQRTAVALRESRRQLLRLRIASGRRHLDDGDYSGALVCFTEALKLEEQAGDPAAVPIHRVRIGSVLQQCPRLEQMLFHGGPVRSGAFNPDARFVVTAGGGGK